MANDHQPCAPSVDIDLSAALANYHTLKDAGGGEAAAVVKCDGYGLGAIAFARTVAIKAGCKAFFVAYPQEGKHLRSQLNDIDPSFEIFVFNGPTSNTLVLFEEFNLTPVINSAEQALLWSTAFPNKPCILHIDTGMNRLGAEFTELEQLKKISSLNVETVMSHLACADLPDAEKNTEQLKAFKEACSHFPSAKTSLASTGGAFLGPSFQSDLTRLGIGLYGVSTSASTDPRLKPVATLTAPILQLRQVTRGETTGYGETFKFERASLVAAVSVGYGDGFLRAASNRASGWIKGKSSPVVGRVSMDITVFDVTDNEREIKVGDRMQLFGDKMPIETVASACGTIGYELLTGLGPRVVRRYLWNGRPAPQELLGA